MLENSLLLHHEENVHLKNCETSIGKELIVQCLYNKSKRSGKPFVKVNCAALPDTLFESEMFGYERGAFTGAEHRKRGKFEQAHGVVLFLDEIGDMSLRLQSKLLHVLQGGDFTPLGSEKAVTTDTWVIAATNHNLENDVKNGVCREDLYYRLSIIKFHIEPLRDRPEDIPHLIEYYIKQYSDMFEDKKLQHPGHSIMYHNKNGHLPLARQCKRASETVEKGSAIEWFFIKFFDFSYLSI